MPFSGNNMSDGAIAAGMPDIPNMPRGRSGHPTNPLQDICRPTPKCVKKAMTNGKKAPARVSLWAGGSLTVEAALVMSLFLLAFYTMFSLFGIVEYQVEMQFALEESARQSAVYGLGGTAAALKANAELYSSLGDTAEGLGLDSSMAVIADISDDNGDEILTVTVYYKLQPSLRLFGSLSYSYEQTSIRRLWTGREYVNGVNGGDADTEYVYVTQNGSVYHTDLDCTYLDLSVSSISVSELSSARNSGGGRYTACSKCVDDEPVSGTVYITDDGSCYHMDSGCSALTRHVMKVSLSETDLPACSRCGQ